MQVLSRRTKNNPVLIGERAWAKRPSSKGWRFASSITMCLRCWRIADHRSGYGVAHRRREFRGEFEDRLKAVIKEVIRARADYSVH